MYNLLLMQLCDKASSILITQFSSAQSIQFIKICTAILHQPMTYAPTVFNLYTALQTMVSGCCNKNSMYKAITLIMSTVCTMDFSTQ